MSSMLASPGSLSLFAATTTPSRFRSGYLACPYPTSDGLAARLLRCALLDLGGGEARLSICTLYVPCPWHQNKNSRLDGDLLPSHRPTCCDHDFQLFSLSLLIQCQMTPRDSTIIRYTDTETGDQVPYGQFR